MAPRRPFTVDPVLTAVAIAYRNPAINLIADQVLPRRDVAQERFGWTEYPLAESFSVPELRVGRRGRVGQVEFTGTEKTDEVSDFGIDSPVPVSDIKAAAAARAAGTSTYDPEARAVEGVMEIVKLGREVRVANLVQNAANYAAGRQVTLAGTSQLSDYANSDPIGVIQAALDGTLVYRPNVVVMGFAAWSVVRRHPKLLKAVKGGLTEDGLLTRQQFADLFEIQKLLIGEGFVNTAAKGQAATLSRVWGKHIAALYINPQASTDQGITWGLTAQFGTEIAGRIEDPHMGLEGGTLVRAGERLKELVVAKDTGYLIQNAVA